MLVKCVCSGCSHSYLADDQAGALACPRCGVENTGAPAVTTMDADTASGRDEMTFESAYHGQGLDLHFAPLAPPAMLVTADRLLRALVFGGVLAALLGAVVGGAQAAVQVAIPGLAGIGLGLVSGIAVRFGLGGRSAARTLGRCIFASLLVLALGFAGVFGGGWLVERYTGTVDRDGNGQPDVAQTREDLEKGLRGLMRDRARAPDEGSGALIDQAIDETERLKRLPDPQLEDYLWSQRAEIAQPVVAYGKLRVLEGPALKLTPKSAPVGLPEQTATWILGGEFLIALVLVIRAVMPR
jgi:hypothetical protein